MNEESATLRFDITVLEDSLCGRPKTFQSAFYALMLQIELFNQKQEIPQEELERHCRMERVIGSDDDYVYTPLNFRLIVQLAKELEICSFEKATDDNKEEVELGLCKFEVEQDDGMNVKPGFYFIQVIREVHNIDIERVIAFFKDRRDEIHTAADNKVIERLHRKNSKMKRS